MPQLRFVHATFAASAVFFMSSLASAIIAPPAGCGTGAACAQGFECTAIAESGCAPSAPCPAGQACPAPEPCEDTVKYGCTPAHCSADSDCSPGMVCHAWQEPCAVSDCACAPGEKCDCGTPVACDPIDVSMCTPRYDLPCTVAADCGAGFTCEETQSCGCSGSAGSAPSGGAPIPAGGSSSGDASPVPPDCSCEPSGVKQCVVVDVTCQSAAQCPAGWSCEQENVATSASACAPGANCPPQPAPMPAVSKCMPPYYGASSGGELEVPSTPTSSNGSGSGTTTGSGSGGGTSTGTPGSGPGTTPIPNEGTPKTTGNSESNESSACQMGHTPASHSAFALLAVLGALFGLKRRRN